MSTESERREVYATNRWRKIRQRVIDRDGGLCVHCAKQNLTIEGTICHHRQPIREGGAPFDPLNLELVCMSCHKWLHTKPSRVQSEAQEIGRMRSFA